MATNQSIFRPKALEHYQHIQMPKTLPKFISPLTLLGYWVLFFVIVTAIVGLWALNVPVLEHGSGVLRQLSATQLATDQLAVQGQKSRTIVLVCFPEQAATTLHPGTSVSVEVAGLAGALTGTVERMQEQTLTARQLQDDYLVPTTASAQPQVIMVAFVSLTPPSVLQNRDRVRATASYQTGTIAVLSLLLQTFSLGGGS